MTINLSDTITRGTIYSSSSQQRMKEYQPGTEHCIKCCGVSRGKHILSSRILHSSGKTQETNEFIFYQVSQRLQCLSLSLEQFFPQLQLAALCIFPSLCTNSTLSEKSSPALFKTILLLKRFLPLLHFYNLYDYLV